MAVQKRVKAAPRPISKNNSTGNKQGLTIDYRLGWLTAAAFSILISTTIAFNQLPHPDPWYVKRIFSADWWQYPVEQNAFRRLPAVPQSLLDAAILPDGTLVTVGADSLIIRSNDGGLSWQQAQISWTDSPQGQQPADGATLSFISPALADQGAPEQTIQRADSTSTLSSTIEGVQSVTPIRSENKTENRPGLETVFFIDGKSGWAAGENGSILHTRDGGRNWSSRQIPGIANRLTTLHFVDAQTGWAAGDDGIILHTSDGGQNWQVQAADAGNYLEGIFFTDREHGRAIGSKYGSPVLLQTRNGGLEWQPQILPDARYLKDIFFIDSQYGWIVGDDTVLYTSDGGLNWTRQSPGTNTQLRSIRFVDLNNGWISGESGTILHTRDGGQNWVRQNTNTSDALFAIRFIDSEKGWTVGNNGSILHTRDGGATWVKQTSGIGDMLNGIYFVDADTGWATGAKSPILHTRDGGRTWVAQTRETMGTDFTSIYFTDLKTGWVTAEKKLLHTDDGGLTWTTQLDNQKHLNPIYFTDSKTGWVSGLDHILRTDDGGQTWTPHTHTKQYFTGLHFIDSKTGWESGFTGTILHTGDGGQTWTSQASGVNADLLSIYFIDPVTGWTVGSNGTILHTIDGGRNWAAQTSGTKSDLFSIYFIDSQHGWAGGMDGLLYTPDGGRNWTLKTSGFREPVTSIRFIDTQTGWAVAPRGRILHTTDAGETWQNIVQYRRLPAPWYYLSWLLTFGLLTPALRRPRALPQSKTSIADMMASDSPLRLGDPDPLHFNIIARSLSRFIRNENTKPPLTVAVTGSWGSGKSSLMNLLAGDLRRVGFRPIWFNVWHHQQEEHLLAALLANIRRQAVPPLFIPRPPFINIDNIAFRYRLLLRRGPRQWLMWLLTLLVLSTSAAFLTRGFHSADAIAGLGELQSADIWRALINPFASLQGKWDLVAFTTALATAAGAFLKAVNAFGINPAKLMSSIDTQIGSGGKLESRLSFRYSFAQEFEDVTHALKPLTMVILIDDLDRCRSERILQILEAVNFLVTSGQCIIVLGMDYEVVRQSVALEYRDLADQIKKENPENGDSKAERFAAEYLEKLINIQVPVPRLAAYEAGKVMAGEESYPGMTDGLRIHASFFIKSILPYALVLLTAIIGYQLGDYLASSKKETADAAAITGIANPATPTPGSQPATPARAEPGARREQTANNFIPGELHDGSWFNYALAPLCLLVFATVLVWLRRSNVVVKDSLEFKEALKIWAQVVQHHRNTPRSIKRFLNRTRYFAMRLRDNVETGVPHEDRGFTGRLKELFGANATASGKTMEELNEAMVVAMSAIHHFDPALIQNAVLSSYKFTKETEVLKRAIADHKGRFEQWPPTEEQLAQFKALTRGIEVR